MNLLEQNPELVGAIVGGLIATLGSVVALITAHMLREAGKVTARLSFSEILLQRRDNAGGNETTDFANFTSLFVSLGIDMYNSSDVQRSLRDLQIEIVTRSKRKKTSSYFIPYTYVGPPGSMMPYGKFQFVNLPPKELKHLELRCTIDRAKIKDPSKDVSICLKGLYPNGRRFRAFLLTTELK